ncbi:MAG TPA: hypothetical protein VKZ18_06635 [Polyangia bacterium]|nr:hypothetical protein [Polyangia bacterium]
MSNLLPCPACQRHIDAVERVCPFCAAPLPAAFAATPPRAMPPRRLGRAALMAAGATLWTASCSGESLGGAKDASAITTGAGGTVAPAYGGPGPVGTGGSTGAGGTAVAAYGAPIPTGGTFGRGGTTGAGGSAATGGTSGSTDGAAPDGASDASSTPPRDASQDRSFIAIYGLASPDTEPQS